MHQPTEFPAQHRLHPPPPQLDPAQQSAFVYQKVAGLANEIWRLSLQLQTEAPHNDRPSHGIQADLQRLNLNMNLLDAHTKQLLELQRQLPEPPATAPDTSTEGRKTKKLFTDRVCADCGTQFTSQWRTGPMGPSTLCNACGIRYSRKLKKERKSHKHEQQLKESAAHPEPEGSAEKQGVTRRSSIEYLLN